MLNNVQFEADYAQKCKYIDNLTAFGVFTPEQGQILKQNMMKETNNDVSPKTVEFNVFDEFEKENPTFFKSRENLKKYLSEADVKLNKDEFEKIATLVAELETRAIERFKENEAHKQMLQEANKKALERLNTTSAQAQTGAIETKAPFTRAQISAMSQDEFGVNEKAIMEQLAKGLIK